MSKRIHIKLNVPETALVMSIASALRIRPEDMTKQAVLEFSRGVLREARERQSVSTPPMPSEGESQVQVDPERQGREL